MGPNILLTACGIIDSGEASMLDPVVQQVQGLQGGCGTL